MKNPAIIAVLVIAIVVALGGFAAIHMQHASLSAVSSTASTTVPVSTGDTGVSTTTTTTTTTHTPTKPVIVPPAGSYKNVVLKLGDAAQFYGDLVITPKAVLSDSRCPLGVMCIQRGNISLSIDVTSHGVKTTHTIVDGKSITVGSETITLLSADPVKRMNATIAPADYRFTFDIEKTTVATGKCYVGGCSSELCTDQPGAISTCIYTASYGCYRNATCERQSTGACGWTQTPALAACLANPPA